MKNQKGVTLIEVIAAVAIIGMVILSFTQLSMSHRSSDVQSDRINEANLIMEQIINEIRSEPITTDELKSIISKYNISYASKYSFYTQNQSIESSITFANPCSGTEQSASIPFSMFYIDKIQVFTITACWSTES